MHLYGAEHYRMERSIRRRPTFMMENRHTHGIADLAYLSLVLSGRGVVRFEERSRANG